MDHPAATEAPPPPPKPPQQWRVGGLGMRKRNRGNSVNQQIIPTRGVTDRRLGQWAYLHHVHHAIACIATQKWQLFTAIICYVMVFKLNYDDVVQTPNKNHRTQFVDSDIRHPTKNGDAPDEGAAIVRYNTMPEDKEPKENNESRSSNVADVSPIRQQQCERQDMIQFNYYTVCNGLSNQLAGHAAFIASFIMSGKKVTLPDAFIFNGIQSERNTDGQTLKNVVATKDNSIPLTSIIDADTLLKTIRQYGVDACFIPHDMIVMSRKEHTTSKCSWLQQLRSSDNDIVATLLDAMKPSIPLSGIVKSVTSKIGDKLTNNNNNFISEEGVCLHYRNGTDWHNHCSIWKGNNCKNSGNRAIVDLVKERIPATYPKKWMYYVGDATPSERLVETMKEHTNLTMIHRIRDNLALSSYDEIRELVKNGSEELSLEKHRDIFAVIDFFVCKSVPSFIGNSVSTFSALQIATRQGKNSSWYNSRSVPLLNGFLQAKVIPIVYTYTEESQAMGKILLKASITSVRQTFGMDIGIHVIYHGTEDRMFMYWLEKRKVTIHVHEPKWLPMIEDMLLDANHMNSHLYSHRGNYIGTWQRIDIPLFIDAEYVIFLDSDTIVRNKFDFSTFGDNITPGIAFSSETDEKLKVPSNAGVALLNVPLLRETYNEFLAFIQDHAQTKKDFVLGPSDQGAYLDFYHSFKNPGVVLRHEVSTYVQYLDQTFNVKPYYKNKDTFDKRRVIHFHGFKPQDLLKGLMGYGEDEFAPALHGLFKKIFRGNDHNLLCLALRDFALSVTIDDDEDNLHQFCKAAFPFAHEEEITCKFFFQTLSKQQEGGHSNCKNILKLDVSKQHQHPPLSCPSLLYYTVAAIAVIFSVYHLGQGTRRRDLPQ